MTEPGNYYGYPQAPYAAAQAMSEADLRRLRANPAAFDHYYRQAQQAAAQEAYAGRPGFWTAEVHRMDGVIAAWERERANTTLAAIAAVLTLIFLPVAGCATCMCVASMNRASSGPIQNQPSSGNRDVGAQQARSDPPAYVAPPPEPPPPPPPARPAPPSGPRCCDGTAARCTGRGCCSHHGGVCSR